MYAAESDVYLGIRVCVQAAITKTPKFVSTSESKMWTTTHQSSLPTMRSSCVSLPCRGRYVCTSEWMYECNIEDIQHPCCWLKMFLHLWFRSLKPFPRWTKTRWATGSTSPSASLQKSPTTTISPSKTTEVKCFGLFSHPSCRMVFVLQGLFCHLLPFDEIRSKRNQMEAHSTRGEQQVPWISHTNAYPSCGLY